MLRPARECVLRHGRTAMQNITAAAPKQNAVLHIFTRNTAWLLRGVTWWAIAG